MIPDILLVGDKEGAARLGLQVEFGAVGLAADDGPREGLSVNRAPAGISRLRVLAAQQPVGGILRRCDHRRRLGAVGLSFFDDSAAFRSLDGHIDGAGPAAVVARRGNLRDIGLFVAAGAVAGLAAVGLAGGLDIDGEVLLPVMAQRAAGHGFYMGGVALTGFFHQTAFSTGGRDGFRFPIVSQRWGGCHGFVGAALPLAGGGRRSGFGAGRGGGRFQVMAQRGNFFPFLNDITADFAGLALGQTGFGAGGRGLLDDIPAVGGAIMIDGQLDRQIFPDVIDMETFEVIIARFPLNLFVLTVDDLVRCDVRFICIAVGKGIARKDRIGLGGAGQLLARLGIKEFGDGGDRNLRQGLGLYSVGINCRSTRICCLIKGCFQPDLAVIQR